MNKNKQKLSEGRFWIICLVAALSIILLLIMGITIGDIYNNCIAYISAAISIISAALVVVTYLRTSNLTIGLNEKNEQRVWERELLSNFPDIKSGEIKLGCVNTNFGREIFRECGLWIDDHEEYRYIWLKNGESYDPGYSFTIRDVEISCDAVISNSSSVTGQFAILQKLKKKQYHVLNGERLNIVLIGSLEKKLCDGTDAIKYLEKNVRGDHIFKVKLKITSDFTNNKTMELMNYKDKKYTTGRVVWQYDLLISADKHGNKNIKVLSIEKHFPTMEGA